MNVSQATFTHPNLLQQSTVKNAVQKYGKHQHGKQSDNSISRKTEKNMEYSVDISPDGKQKAKDANNDLQKMVADFQGAKAQLNNISEQGQGIAEAAKIRMICMKIALRIMKGDNVPKEDHQYLLKHDPKLYAEAITKRMPNMNPEEHDRLSEDEESDTPGNAGDSVFDMPAPPDSVEAAAQQL